MKTRIQTDKAPQAIGPYSQGIKMGNLVYTAGMVGVDPATGKLVEGGIEAQTRRALQNISAVLQAAGCSFDDVIKTTVFLTDLASFAAMNGVYKEHFGDEPYPVRSTIQVAGLPLGAMVEIECLAVVEGGDERRMTKDNQEGTTARGEIRDEAGD